MFRRRQRRSALPMISGDDDRALADDRRKIKKDAWSIARSSALRNERRSKTSRFFTAVFGQLSTWFPGRARADQGARAKLQRRRRSRGTTPLEKCLARREGGRQSQLLMQQPRCFGNHAASRFFMFFGVFSSFKCFVV